MKPSLQQAIEGVYEVFRDVPRPTSVDGCRCCIDEAQIRRLLSKPLCDLSPDDLTHYASSVLLTVGEVEDFLYFLPRILEILASEADWWPSPEVVAGAMHTAGFGSWSEVRRQAITRYFDEIIECYLATADSGWALDSWVCALGRLRVDLSPFLARIMADGSRLVEFYEVHSQPLTDGRLANGFWDEAPEQRQLVINWFRSTETENAILAHYGLA